MRPLDGIFILDLSRVLAAPLATSMLAEMGADVVRVERPGVGDELRNMGPYLSDYPDVSAYFFLANRHKKSITANIKDETGQKILRDLAKQADVVVENYVPGTLARYGLDYDSLKKVNDRLVYVSTSGFGQTGPYSDRKGYDTVFQAMSGITGMTGHPDGEPTKVGFPVSDMSASLWVIISIMLGLRGRDLSGHGNYTDLSIFDTQVALMGVPMTRFFVTGESPPRTGNSHLSRIPSCAFACKGDQWVHISCGEAQWPALCEALDITDWGMQPENRTNSGRVKRGGEVLAYLAAEIAKWDRSDLMEVFQAKGVAVGPINSVGDIYNDPHVKAREMIGSFTHPEVGEFPAIRVPLRFKDMDNPEMGRPPPVGRTYGRGAVRAA